MCHAANRCRYWLVILSLFLTINHSSAANAPNTVQNDSESNVDEQGELVKVDQTQGISVYYRNLPSGNIEFKGVIQIKSTLSSIIAVFLDVQNMPQWLYRTEKVTLLRRLDSYQLYIYTIHSMPFPFRNRDSVNRIQLTQIESTKMVTIDVYNSPDYIERNDDYVRVPTAVSQWQLLPVANGEIKITFSGYGEPGGSISADTYHSSLFQWLIKQFLWKVPYKSLLGLKEHVNREQYRNRTFDFIQEPNDS